MKRCARVKNAKLNYIPAFGHYQVTTDEVIPNQHILQTKDLFKIKMAMSQL